MLFKLAVDYNYIIMLTYCAAASHPLILCMLYDTDMYRCNSSPTHYEQHKIYEYFRLKFNQTYTLVLVQYITKYPSFSENLFTILSSCISTLCTQFNISSL